MEREDEDVTTFNFGPEFAGNVECLSDAEVLLLLTRTIKTRGGEDEVGPLTLKTRDYCTRSLSERNTQELTEFSVRVRQDVKHLVDDIHNFEIAALCNLMSEDSEPEEAKALIPSLQRYDDDLIEKVIAVVAAKPQAGGAA
mmetsp:Transcript_9386/g.30614  ORF Transcript_9386/g.30614 Transcript_9386/m.30614 type:complete len:141 (+) Transcript_9386:21-443(+)